MRVVINICLGNMQCLVGIRGSQSDALSRSDQGQPAVSHAARAVPAWRDNVRLSTAHPLGSRRVGSWFLQHPAAPAFLTTTSIDLSSYQNDAARQPLTGQLLSIL